jgi:hypothetical protein
VSRVCEGMSIADDQRRYGSIYCLVNNGALGGSRVSVHEKTYEEYNSVMDVKCVLWWRYDADIHVVFEAPIY